MAGMNIHPPKFEGDFAWWKKRMEVFFETDFDIMLIMENGFEVPRDEENEPLEKSRWTKKQREEHLANSKAKHHLLNVLPQQEVNRLGECSSAKEMWDKLVELHEGTSEAKLARRDLFRSQLQNIKLETNEKVSSLHSRFKEIINGLSSVGEKMSNRDMLMKAIDAFPRTSKWSSMVDSYYISKNLEVTTLDEFFSTMELHENRVGQQEAPSYQPKGVALVANKEKGKKKKTPSPSSSDSDSSSSSMGSDEDAYMVRRVRKAFKKFKFSKSNHDRKKGRVIICYNCQGEGHMRDECPLLKKKEEKKKKKEEKKKSKEKGKKPKEHNLQVTWDDPQPSSDEEENVTSHFAFMGIDDIASTSSEQEASSSEEESSSEGGASSSSSSSSSSDGEDMVSKVKSLPPKKLVKIIASLSKDLYVEEKKVKSLKNTINVLEDKLANACSNVLNASTSSNDACLVEENRTLREKVDYLTRALEKFTIGSNTLNLIIGSQRANFNKKGLGFKESKNEKAYHCLIARGQPKTTIIARKWIPKEYLVNPIKKNHYWVPKSILKG